MQESFDGSLSRELPARWAQRLSVIELCKKQGFEFSDESMCAVRFDSLLKDIKCCLDIYLLLRMRFKTEVSIDY